MAVWKQSGLRVAVPQPIIIYESQFSLLQQPSTSTAAECSVLLSSITQMIWLLSNTPPPHQGYPNLEIMADPYILVAHPLPALRSSSSSSSAKKSSHPSVFLLSRRRDITKTDKMIANPHPYYDPYPLIILTRKYLLNSICTQLYHVILSLGLTMQS